jgi:hypothetical protein
MLGIESHQNCQGSTAGGRQHSSAPASAQEAHGDLPLAVDRVTESVTKTNDTVTRLVLNNVSAWSNSRVRQSDRVLAKPPEEQGGVSSEKSRRPRDRTGQTVPVR